MNRLDLAAREIVIEETGCDGEVADRVLARLHKMPSIRKRILLVLHKDRSMTTTQLAGELGETRQATVSMCCELHREGKIMQVRRAHGQEAAWALPGRVSAAPPLGPTLIARITTFLQERGPLSTATIAKALEEDRAVVFTCLTEHTPGNVRRLFTAPGRPTYWGVVGEDRVPQVEVSLRDRVLALYADGRRRTAREAAVEIGERKSTVIALLGRLARKGSIGRAHAGSLAPGEATVWVCADAGACGAGANP